jgi:Flp pilus assembly protein TadG
MSGSAADVVAGFGRLVRDTRGVSAVEFAILLPLMLSLYIGTFEISQAVTAKRKVTLTAHTVADLVARVTTLSKANMDDILSASTTVMAPFAVNNNIFRLVVSSVNIDAQGAATILWSCASDGSVQYSVGQSVTVPAGIAPPSSTVIWGTARYQYTPIIMGGSLPFYTMSGPLTLTDQMYMAPRMAPSQGGVQLTGGC